MLHDTDTPVMEKRDRGQSVATRVIRANRNHLFIASVGIISIGAAMCMSTLAVIYTRPTHVSTKGVLTGQDNLPVKMTPLVTESMLRDLPAQPNHSLFDSLQTVIYMKPADYLDGQAPAEASKKIVGWTWYNSTLQALSTSRMR